MPNLRDGVTVPNKANLLTPLIAIPQMEDFNDVRVVMAKAISDLQRSIQSQLPLTDMGGRRLSNLGDPVASADAVTLRYLQGGAPLFTSVTGVGGFTTGSISISGSLSSVVVELSISGGTTTINPPSIATSGVFLTYFIAQGNPSSIVAWGSITGSAFMHPPVVDTTVNTISVVSFIGRADGNWWTFPLLGVHP